MTNNNYSIIILMFTFIGISSCKKDAKDSPLNDNNNTSVSWGNTIQSNVFGKVVDVNGNPISGADVSCKGLHTTTNVDGLFFLENASVFENFGYVTVIKNGYFLGSRSFIPLQGGNSLNIILLDKTNIGSFASSSGGTVSDNPNPYQAVKITFQPNSFTSNGQIYNGVVRVAIKHINHNYPNQMPGSLVGVRNGTNVGLTSFGMIAVELSGNNGQELQLASGKTATVSIPAYNNSVNYLPTEIDFWSFDEINGFWKPEGKATLLSNMYTATVSHFSFWNCDAFWSPIKIEGRILDLYNNPIQGAQIQLSSPTLGYAVDLSNSNGRFGGFVPTNELLTLKVTVCGNEVYSSQVGPFFYNSTLTPISVSSPYFTTIIGSLVDCNSNIVPNGYIVSNGNVYYMNNGQFSFGACGSSVSLSTFSLPSWSSGQSLTTAISGGLYNVGNLILCNGGNIGSVTDIDNNVYQTVQIGSQTWMAENLRVTHYSNGDTIPWVNDGTWTMTKTLGAWASLGSQYEIPYGKYYNWYAVNDNRNICPVGWHVASSAEWDTLANYLGGEGVAGGKMKTVGTQYWKTPNTGATNQSGFSAVPYGKKNEAGAFSEMDYKAYFWTSDNLVDDGTNHISKNRIISYNGVGVTSTSNYSNNGFSVRCIKD